MVIENYFPCELLTVSTNGLIYVLETRNSQVQLYSVHLDIKFWLSGCKQYFREKCYQTAPHNSGHGNLDVHPASLMWNISLSFQCMTHPRLQQKMIITCCLWTEVRKIFSNPRKHIQLCTFHRKWIQPCTNWSWQTQLVVYIKDFLVDSKLEGTWCTGGLNTLNLHTTGSSTWRVVCIGRHLIYWLYLRCGTWVYMSISLDHLQTQIASLAWNLPPTETCCL